MPVCASSGVYVPRDTRELGVHASCVRRVLGQAGEVDVAHERRSIVDPYMPFILATLEKYPKLAASRLYQMVRGRGYPGGESRFRDIIAVIRPRPKAEAFMCLRTLPGEQGQVDWGSFGKIRIGRAERALLAFVLVLSWSRRIYLRFFIGSRMPCFLAGHALAFARLGGVPRVVLYDNLKSAVIERRGHAIRLHPTMLELAAHYGCPRRARRSGSTPSARSPARSRRRRRSRGSAPRVAARAASRLRPAERSDMRREGASALCVGAPFSSFVSARRRRNSSAKFIGGIRRFSTGANSANAASLFTLRG